MLKPETPPPWTVTEWLNTPLPLSLEGLKGRVVVMHAFQMLCKGCVTEALPQMQRLAEQFSAQDVAVIGLHTVFEHKEVMTPAALKAFVHEFGWTFPIGIDAPGEAGRLPRTMAAYEMQGTPTLLIFDRAGRLRRHYFGKPDDLLLGAEVTAFVLEQDARETERMLARALVMPGQTHGAHAHAHGDDCGCGHDHAHDHGHDHAHDHGHHHHDHGPEHDHGHHHDHDHGHDHGHAPVPAVTAGAAKPAAAKPRGKAKTGKS